MSKDGRRYDLEDRLIDFAVRAIRTAESCSDFVLKMTVCLKELWETRIWSLIIVKTNLIIPVTKLEPLIKENNELISIFVKKHRNCVEKG